MSYTLYAESDYYDGPYSPSLGSIGIISKTGCPYRGTTVCLVCPLGEQIAAVCDYNCYFCEHKHTCKCGHDQTLRLKAWGLIE